MNQQFKYQFVICAIIKNEYPHYLQEWLTHHFSIGFEHVYIYNNGDPFGFPLIFSSRITMIPWPGRVKQMLAYADFIKQCKIENLTNWVAFIDSDEFIYCQLSRLDELDAKNPHVGGIVLNWRIYGSSGLLTADTRPQREKFVYRLPDSNKYNLAVKTIAHPSRLIRMGCPHRGFYTKPYYHINIRGERVGLGMGTKFAGPEHIKHYWVRSKEEYEKKIQRGRATTTAKRSVVEFTSLDAQCTIKD